MKLLRPDRDGAEEAVALLARAFRRARGEYREDEWGFDREFAESALPAFEFLFERWWRVEVEGIENLPGQGRTMIVANHSGAVFPFDAIMIGTAIQKLHPQPRWPRALVLDWVFELPFVSYLMRRLGAVPADPANLSRLLGDGEAVMVFPEGVKGFGKPFSERYRTQRFGRGGFVEEALRTGTPIVPVAVVGAEETYPKLGEIGPLARLTGAPYIPLTPTFPLLGPLGLIPLPSRWRIVFLEPIDLSEHPPEAAGDPSLVFDLAEQVRQKVQQGLYRGLVERGPAFG